MNSPLRVVDLGEPVERAVFVRVIRARPARPCPRSSRVRLGLAVAADRAAAFWEMLSYGVLWLSGLIGIGLCFL